MLFSNKDIADYINYYFEPAWESLRPVPVVTVDFGNGHVLTRTLNGNIATCVCRPDGRVLDVLPGIYAPNVYRHELAQLQMVNRFVGDSEVYFKSFHEHQRVWLENSPDPLQLKSMIVRTGFALVVIEERVLRLLEPTAGDLQLRKAEAVSLANQEDLDLWKLLAKDTEFNEKVRRRMVHELLLKTGMAKPDQIVKPLFKDVLLTDLDDPYLGLKEKLETVRLPEEPVIPAAPPTPGKP